MKPIKESEHLNLDKVAPKTRGENPQKVSLITFASQEGAPAKTAVDTRYMATNLADYFQEDAGAKLGISLSPTI